MTKGSLCRKSFSVKQLDNIRANIFMFDYLNKSGKKSVLNGYYSYAVCSHCAQAYANLFLCGFSRTGIDAENLPAVRKYVSQTFRKYYNLSKKYKNIEQYCSKERIMIIRLFKFNRFICSLICIICKNILQGYRKVRIK